MHTELEVRWITRTSKPPLTTIDTSKRNLHFLRELTRVCMQTLVTKEK